MRSAQENPTNIQVDLETNQSQIGDCLIFAVLAGPEVPGNSVELPGPRSSRQKRGSFVACNFQENSRKFQGFEGQRSDFGLKYKRPYPFVQIDLSGIFSSWTLSQTLAWAPNLSSPLLSSNLCDLEWDSSESETSELSGTTSTLEHLFSSWAHGFEVYYSWWFFHLDGKVSPLSSQIVWWALGSFVSFPEII